MTMVYVVGQKSECCSLLNPVAADDLLDSLGAKLDFPAFTDFRGPLFTSLPEVTDCRMPNITVRQS